MKILAIESSCDETACAIVEDGRRVLANVVASQIKLHAQYGGVIPELAAREHLVSVDDVVEHALNEAKLALRDIDAFAATIGPGLIGSLLVGTQAAKTLSILNEKPFHGVNHLQGHIASNYLESELKPPFLCLLVSGGHTQLLDVQDYQDIRLLGETLDDAIGEAYDKIARLLGLDYPGGPNLDKLAQTGNPNAYDFPEAQCQKPYDFSFSGLKTAVMKCIEKSDHTEESKADIAASFQATAVSTLVKKTLQAAHEFKHTQIAVAGGVAANSALRKTFETQCAAASIGFYRPQMKFCTDNAAMIASAAYYTPVTHRIDCDVFSRA